MDNDRRSDIRETLKSILIFIGSDVGYADYAQLQSYLNELIERNR